MNSHQNAFDVEAVFADFDLQSFENGSNGFIFGEFGKIEAESSEQTVNGAVEVEVRAETFNEFADDADDGQSFAKVFLDEAVNEACISAVPSGGHVFLHELERNYLHFCRCPFRGGACFDVNVFSVIEEIQSFEFQFGNGNQNFCSAGIAVVFSVNEELNVEFYRELGAVQSDFDRAGKMNAEVFVGANFFGADGTSGFPQIVEEQFSVNFWFFDAAPFAFAVNVAVWSKVAELFAAFAANSLSLASRSFAVFADNVLRALFWRVRIVWRWWWIFLAASSKNANNQRKQQNHD